MRSKRLLINIITNLLLEAIIVIHGFIIPKIIISSFGSDVNGLVASITQFLAYISLLEAGFGPVVKAMLYKPIALKQKETIKKILKSAERFFRRIAVIFLIYMAVLCIVYPSIANSDFDRFYTVSLIAIIGISTFSEYFFGMTYKMFLQAKQKQFVISIIQICTYIVSIVVVILLAKCGAGVHVIKLASGLIFVFRPIIQNYYVKKKYAIDLRNTGTIKIKQKWDGLAQHVAWVIHSNTDIVVLTLFSTLEEVSVYSVYYLVIKGVKSLTQAFANGVDSTFGDMIAKDEKTNLNKKFSVYELIYGTVSTVVFSVTIVLITSFVALYTNNVSDANYVRPLFGVLLTVGEFVWIIRQPYNNLIKAAGKFKETRIGAWIECIANIVISIALVNWLGLIGVAIGTLIAMTIRTCEFIYFSNKHILKRPVRKSVIKVTVQLIEMAVIVFIGVKLSMTVANDYLNFFGNCVIMFSIALVLVLIINICFFRKEATDLLKLSRNILNRKKKE